MINKVLFITLSNIGDVIMTLPALDTLREYLPHSKITVMCGERTRELFEDNPFIERVVVYNKHARLREKRQLLGDLRREKFDVVIDLRNSALGFFIPARYKTSPFAAVSRSVTHMYLRHLQKVKRLLAKMKISRPAEKRETTLWICARDKSYVSELLHKNHIALQDNVIVISADARSHIKQWPKEKVERFISHLVERHRVKVILVGEKAGSGIAPLVDKNPRGSFLDLSGRTTLLQLAYLLRYARLVITNDSAVSHLASYQNIPVLVLFGPTDETKYGPWSDNAQTVKKDIVCRPCEKARCKFGTLACIEHIHEEDVMTAVEDMLALASRPSSLRPLSADQNNSFKRILIVRTDRIGDVVLSTPVIKALRRAYPHAYIAMMVSPFCREIVVGNPYLDEVITFDKDKEQKGWVRSIAFSRRLREKRFDAALVLHPTVRVHLLAFFAGIPRRIGYDRKAGILLTDKIPHRKHLGEKHELEYNLDVVRYLGIEPLEKNVFMPLLPEGERFVQELFKKEQIAPSQKILVLHPGASCASKRWPLARFAEAADTLIDKHGLKVFIVAAQSDMNAANSVAGSMRHAAVNLAGKTSLCQLASLFKRSNLFISNDSGPVHIACAVGIPVISIFGRKQKGLSPQRWGPVSDTGRVLHKDAGCEICLAHECRKGFLCLSAITVHDVIEAADALLRQEKSPEYIER